MEEDEAFGWLREKGLSEADLRKLKPSVPGQFTLPGGYYVNTATPGQVYLGTEEGTLPMVTGRWFAIPQDIAGRFPDLTRDPARLAEAVRLTRRTALTPDAPLPSS